MDSEISTPSISPGELKQAPSACVAAKSSHLDLWVALAATVLAALGVAYSWKGSAPLSAMPAPTRADAAPHATGSDQANALVEGLALKLKERPQDAEGWAMLARSYAVLGRHAQALPAFERAMALRPDDASLREGYANSIALAANVPAAAGVQPDILAKGSVSNPAAAKSTVSGRVTLASSLAKMASPEDTIFIFARAAQGERTPLAVLRKQVKDLPLEFTLDDSMGMSPQNRLSAAGQVVISARISKSGQAMPQSGDISGQAAAVNVGTSGIAIEIRELVK